ncbi:hypothetical protein SHIRM173S_03228 [Streptomyces hirsutus]
MMTISTHSWDSPAATLLITGEGLTPGDVTRTLGISPSLYREPTADSRFRPGEGVWAIQVTAGPHQGLEEALDELADLISGVLEGIRELEESGLTVQVDLSGRTSHFLHSHTSESGPSAAREGNTARLPRIS